MAKPIFTIGLSYATQEQIRTIQDRISKQFEDYHILVYCEMSDKTVFNVFYEKDFDELKYKELKEMVINDIKS